MMWIIGSKLEIELKLDLGLTLDNIFLSDAQIGFLIVPLVLEGDFIASMYFIIIFKCPDSILIFQVS